jgi:hypothetical protein
MAAFLTSLAKVLQVAPMSGEQWALVAILSATPAVVGQVGKAVRVGRA